MSTQQAPYICAALTELDPSYIDRVKAFYVQLGDLCQDVTGVRGFVPCEHYDPIKNADTMDTEVYAAERKIVTRKTSILIVYAIEPSWGAGIEVGWANENHVPIVILVPRGKKVSRVLTGGPMVKAVINVKDEEDAIVAIGIWLAKYSAIVREIAEREKMLRDWEMTSEDPLNEQPLRCETLDSLKGKASSRG